MRRKERSGELQCNRHRRNERANAASLSAVARDGRRRTLGSLDNRCPRSSDRRRGEQEEKEGGGFLKSCRNKSQETEDPFWGGGWGFGGAEDKSPSRF
ncbi:hypothetical protein OUZ56_009207 [Daphnia magna]|uniref:Uncharacterized protein n=1 Tax=Daphnia magna TaxID=35525 RepID=A0ABR0AFB0_9CRUS|nr:hypothetical protein OUZ56_009207 [Daphnia magna]